MSKLPEENSEKKVQALKKELDQLKAEKEKWFKKKEDLKEVVNDKIKEIKSLNIDGASKIISVLRKERDRLNKHVGGLIRRIKGAKFRTGPSPQKIQEKINEIEKKIEVETNFKKEQELMDEIKKLKKEREETKGQEDRRELEKNIKVSKKKADDVHKQIKDAADDKKRKKFTEISKEINKLKKEQEDAFAKFIEFKNKFNAKHKEFKNLSKKLGKGVKKFKKPQKKKFVVDNRAKIKEKEEKIIAQKVEKVEEKLKKKQKLTTEDIIALQGKKD